ncbi:hypothetical protein P4V41_07705 [Fictibacillus nanhaiensis]|uniref:hypothetical protein n=1 Tax=Fictibacillus nanhaiensis TaxID=742169 RepID=UPI002E1C69B7|nr:hypothetical protein [Fictibacillus nanhaiensis]
MENYLDLQIKIEIYEEALEKLNELAIYYDSRGWALNPDKVGEIVANALKFKD